MLLTNILHTYYFKNLDYMTPMHNYYRPSFSGLDIDTIKYVSYDGMVNPAPLYLQTLWCYTNALIIIIIIIMVESHANCCPAFKTHPGIVSGLPRKKVAHAGVKRYQQLNMNSVKSFSDDCKCQYHIRVKFHASNSEVYKLTAMLAVFPTYYISHKLWSC